MDYNVDYFIKMFSAIPENLWCIRTTLNDKGQRCAYGHTRQMGVVNEFENLDIKYRDRLKLTWIGNAYKQQTVFADINNGYYAEYQQLTPKQRILAALHDIKKMEDMQSISEYKDITKDLAILPVEETSDTLTVKNNFV